MNKIDYNPNSLSHNHDNIRFWVTQGIVIDDVKYAIEELFIRANKLYAVITEDKKTFYEYPLATNVQQATFDSTQLENRLSRLENAPQYRYDDTGIIQRLTALENTDATELTGIKQRLINLENKPDNDKQKLSYSNGVLSIENGNSVNVPMSIGKSAYQTWLDLGNTGTEQDFINSLKGAKGDKGEVTDIGTNALVKFLCDITSTNVFTSSNYDYYRTFSYNTKSQLGTVHLDVRSANTMPDGHVIGKLPDGAPKPYALIEISVIGNKSDGTGQIYIHTDGIIRCNALIPGRRYIVDLMGYYVYK